MKHRHHWRKFLLMHLIIGLSSLSVHWKSSVYLLRTSLQMTDFSQRTKKGLLVGSENKFCVLCVILLLDQPTNIKRGRRFRFMLIYLTDEEITSKVKVSLDLSHRAECWYASGSVFNLIGLLLRQNRPPHKHIETVQLRRLAAQFEELHGKR